MHWSVRNSWPARVLPALALILAAGCSRPAVAPPVPRADKADADVIRFVQEGEAQYIEAFDAENAVQTALGSADDAKLSAALAVRSVKNGPPMLGAYSVTNRDQAKAIRFVPRFTLSPGLSYAVTFNTTPLVGEQAGRTRESVIAVPKQAGPPPEVVAVYPSGDVLPENQLRFYVHFSNPMRRGEAYSHFHLIGPQGEDRKQPFHALDEELWDETGKRLSLLFNPGRVKKGLVPREQDGPVLVAGNKYTLLIDDGLCDARGERLSREHRKEFTAIPPQEAKLDPRTWKLSPPKLPDGSLIVRFDRPLDHGQLSNQRSPYLAVEDVGGRRVAGRVALSEREQCWTFTPAKPWVGGRFALVAHPELSDPCGNTVARSFEEDLDKPRPATPDTPIRLPFEPAP